MKKLRYVAHMFGPLPACHRVAGFRPTRDNLIKTRRPTCMLVYASCNLNKFKHWYVLISPKRDKETNISSEKEE